MLGFAALGRLALGQARAASATLIAASAGSYTLTGQAALFSISVPLGAGAFTLTGNDAVFPVSMPAAAGSYALTGQALTLAAAASIYCSPYPANRARFVGFSALGGAALGQGSSLSIGTTYTLRGSDIAVAFGMAASAGSYTLTGSDARLVEGYVLSALGGSYSIAGQDAQFSVSVPLEAGSYTLSGQVIDLTRGIAKIKAFPRVGAPGFAARSTGRDAARMRAFGG
jgi:hypothetical protein